VLARSLIANLSHVGFLLECLSDTWLHKIEERYVCLSMFYGRIELVGHSSSLVQSSRVDDATIKA
jgi:hypothetical protein